MFYGSTLDSKVITWCNVPIFVTWPLILSTIFVHSFPILRYLHYCHYKFKYLMTLLVQTYKQEMAPCVYMYAIQLC